MADTSKDGTLSLKVMVNKEKTKVLFAEADTDFVSVLLSFLLLPLGRIVKLMEKHYAEKSPVFGSITSLYKGLANLDEAHFSTSAAKRMLLDPPSSSDSVFCNLKLDVFKDCPTKYLVCGASKSCKQKIISVYYSKSAVCNCGRPLNVEVVADDSEDAGVFTVDKASFIISDDLKMVLNSAGFFQTLRNFGNGLVDGAEIRSISLGTNEVMDLLKCCLLSTTPLTDFILNKGEIMTFTAKPEPGILLHQIKNEEPAENGKKITLKVIVHKSTDKVLFVEAQDDFIELLFSFLIIPVSAAESLLDTNTCLNSLNNLYRSISDVTLEKYFISLDTKKRLLNPNIPDCSKSRSTFLPLIYENRPTTLYGYYYRTGPLPRLTITNRIFDSLFTFKSPKGEGNYVKEPTAYLVTDDLTVTPFYISSTFSILNSLNISLSDVDQWEVHIGLQEGLSILKASLTSSSALTNGLMNRIMKKQPKQER